MQESAPASPGSLDVTEARNRPRFALSRPIEALVANNRATIRDLSPGGIGVTHAAPVRIGSDVLIRVSAPENDGDVAIRGRLVWSRLSRTPDSSGKYPYNSGVAVADDSPAVAGLMGRLIRAHGIRQPASLDAKRQAFEQRLKSRETPITIATSTRVAPRITPDQEMMIQQARDLLANNPEAAIKWHDRAKYSLVNRGIIASAERSAPYRREVLVVWEYLEGRVDLDIVSALLDPKSRERA